MSDLSLKNKDTVFKLKCYKINKNCLKSIKLSILPFFFYSLYLFSFLLLRDRNNLNSFCNKIKIHVI